MVAFGGFAVCLGVVRDRQEDLRNRRLALLLEAREARGSSLRREL